MKSKKRAKRYDAPKSKDLDEEIESGSDEDISADSGEENEAPYENETAHEKQIRLTKKALLRAKQNFGKNEDDSQELLSLTLKEEALRIKGKLLLNIAHKVHPVNSSSAIYLKGHRKSVTCVCISSDNEHVFSGGKDGSVIKWNILTCKKEQIIKGGKRESSYQYHTGPILSIAIATDGKYLCTGSIDQLAIVWNPENMEVITKLTRHRAPVTAVSFRKGSHMLFTADKSGRVCVWNMPLTELLQDQGARTNIEVLGLCGLRAERCLSCVGYGGAGICVWKVPEETCVQYKVKDAKTNSIECVVAVTDEIFIGGSNSNNLFVWHASRGSPVFSVYPAHINQRTVLSTEAEPFKGVFDKPRPDDWVTSVASLAGTDLIASGSANGIVQLWRLVQPNTLVASNRANRNSQTSFLETKLERQNRAANLGKKSKSGWMSDEDDDDEGMEDNAEEARQVNSSAAAASQLKLERLESLNLEGCINSLAFSDNGKWLTVGLGQEPRMGRWGGRRLVQDAVCLLPINVPIKSSYRMV